MQFPKAVAGCVALAPISFPELRLEHALLGPRAFPLLGTGLNSVANALLDPGMLPLLRNAMLLPQVMPRHFATGFPFGLVAKPPRMLCEGEGAASLAPAPARSAARYATCRVPVHILDGDADLVVDNRVHGAWAAALMPMRASSCYPASVTCCIT